MECPHGYDLYDCMDCSDFVFLYEDNERLRKAAEQHEADAALGRLLRSRIDPDALSVLAEWCEDRDEHDLSDALMDVAKELRRQGGER